MGNVVDSFLSGLGSAINKLLGNPLDFLAGKSCSSVCGQTWDFICYIENFCVAHLVKVAMVAVLSYLVLLFFYLLYKLGICGCICCTLCKMIWSCFAMCFSVIECGCTFLCYKLPRIKRIHRRRRRYTQEFNTSGTDEEDGSFSNHVPRRLKGRASSSRRWKDYRGDHLRRSLRPRSHRIRVGIRGDSMHLNKRISIKNDRHGSRINEVRVHRTSKFAQKGGKYKGLGHRTRRR